MTIDLTTLASSVSLAMDAFSVSICIGLCHESRLTKFESAAIGGAFGFFQFFMPLLGALAALFTAGFLGKLTPWIAGGLILWVSAGMVRDARKNSSETTCMALTFKNIMILALATSLDALALGFSIACAGRPALTLAVCAGAVTFALSYIGADMGAAIGSKVGRRAEYLGAAVLLVIALNIFRTAID